MPFFKVRSVEPDDYSAALDKVMLSFVVTFSAQILKLMAAWACSKTRGPVWVLLVGLAS